MPVMKNKSIHRFLVRLNYCSVTGTNGKTTTVLMILHILKNCREVVGTACTEGMIIENQTIFVGNYSGPGGAKTILEEATVDHVLLEVARRGYHLQRLGV